MEENSSYTPCFEFKLQTFPISEEHDIPEDPIEGNSKYEIVKNKVLDELAIFDREEVEEDMKFNENFSLNQLKHMDLILLSKRELREISGASELKIVIKTME